MRGDGRVYQRGKNSFWAEYWVDGKQFREKAGRTALEAKRKLKLRRQEILAGTFIPPQLQKITIDEVLDSYVRHLALKGARAVNSVESHVRPIRERLGMLRAGNLTAALVEKYMQERIDAGRKPSTVNRSIEDLRAALRLARRQGRLARVPFFEKLREDNVRRVFLDKAQVQLLINYLPDPINDLTQFAFLTAWRKSEITSLRWEFVDRSTREIRIPTSKNLKGRVIPLSGTLGELIEKRRTARAYRKNGIPAVSHYVFHRDGRRMGSFYKTWKTACRKAGLSGVIFHDLRRSGIRSLVRSGVSETVARSISGHQTRSVFDRYDIVDTRDQEEAFRKVEEYLRSQPSEPSVAPIGPKNPHTSRTKKPSEDLRALGTH